MNKNETLNVLKILKDIKSFLEDIFIRKLSKNYIIIKFRKFFILLN